MFEEAFPTPTICQFVSEETQEAEGMATVTATFRVLDEARWMPLLATVLGESAVYSADFSWVIRKEFYVDAGTGAVRYIWTVFAWAHDNVGLRLAARIWRAHMAATRAPAAPAPSAPAPKAATKGRPSAREPAAASAEEIVGEEHLKKSSRYKTIVHGTDQGGVVRSSTRIQLGRRTGPPLYVVTDPAQRTVKATRPGSGALSGETAREGLSGKPRVHVEGCENFDGGAPASVEL